tara:strand:+ start:541 stop:747 length:207 start_codon:yes stop_codon:yes gene_type:complete
MMEVLDKEVPNFQIRKESATDVSTQIRIQKIANGFVVRGHADPPIHYDSQEKLAEAIKAGILKISWDS